MKIQIISSLIFITLIIILSGCLKANNTTAKQILLTAKVYSSDIAISEKIGTAFFIDDDTLITSYHTIENTDQITLLPYPKITVNISKIFKEEDIAYLNLDVPIKDSEHISRKKLGIKSGKLNGAGIYYYNNKGEKIVGKVTAINSDQGFISTDIKFTPTQSGSPIYHAETNHIIGVTDAISDSGHESRISLLPK